MLKRKRIYRFKCSITLSSDFCSLLERTWSEMVRWGHGPLKMPCFKEMAREYHAWSGCLALILSERFSMAWWQRKENYSLATKFLFPFQLQDAESLSLLHRGFQDNSLVARMKLCWDFQQDGLCWVHQCRRCPCPCGVAVFWDQRTGGFVPLHA